MDVLYFIIQQMLIIAIPLILVGLGGMFSERSGVINIALEGIMLIGAFFGALFIFAAYKPDSNSQLLFLVGILIAGLGGILYSLLLAFASVHMKANQVIVGTSLNMLMPAIILLYAKLRFGGGEGVRTSIEGLYIKEVPLLSKIPIIGDMFFKNTYLTVYIGFLLIVVATIFIFKTKIGLRLRACGEHPQAADSVGINVYKMRYLGVILSGFLGGVGGYFYSVGILNSNISGHSGVAGYGFLALAVMIFGQWHPIKIMFAGLFFAFISTLVYSRHLIPFLSNLGIPSAYYQILPYVATLIVLIFTSKKSRAPKAEGIPYDKSTR